MKKNEVKAKLIFQHEQSKSTRYTYILEGQQKSVDTDHHTQNLSLILKS